MKNKRILIASVLAVGAMAMAGSAFTASNTMPADIVKGYGEQLVTGVTVESIVYNLDVNKTNVVDVDLLVTGDTTTLDLQIAYNDVDPATCDGAGTYDGVEDATSYTCTAPIAVHDIERFVVYADGLA